MSPDRLADWDPERENTVARYTVLGLAYRPQLSTPMARAVAHRMYEWSRDDPALKMMVEDDYGAAARETGNSWQHRPGTALEDLWEEAYGIIDTIAGYDSGRTRAEARLRNRPKPGDQWEMMADAFRADSPAERAQWSIGSAFQSLLQVAVAGIAPGQVATEAINRKLDAQTVDAVEFESIERQSAVAATPEYATALIAQALVERGDAATVTAGVDLAIGIFEGLLPDEKDRLMQDIQTLTTEQLVEEFTEFEQEQSTTDAVLQAALNKAVDYARTWDAVAHTMGIELLDQLQKTVGVQIGEPREPGPLSTLMDEGFEAAKGSFDQVKEGGIAGWYGMDPASASAGWINLGASILFDPTTWVTGGGRHSARLFARYMGTGVDGAEAYLRGRGASLVADIAKNTDALTLAPMLHGMSGRARLRLLDETSKDQVTDILRDEIVNGTWLSNGPALAMHHQSIIGLGELGRHLHLGDEVADTVVELLRRQPTNRQIGLGEAEFLDDVTELIVSRFPNDPVRARELLTDSYHTFDDFTRGGETLLVERTAAADALRSEALLLRNSAQRQIKNVPMSRRMLETRQRELLDLETESVTLSEQFDQAVVPDEVTPGPEGVMGQALGLDQRIAGTRDHIEFLSRHLDEWGPQYDDWVDQRAGLLRQRQTLRRANYEASRPRSRADLSSWLNRFMDDWATDLDLPRTANGQVRWGEVRGVSGVGANVSADAPRLAPFDEFADELSAAGIATGGSQYWLPISPYEMALYQAAQRSGHTARARALIAKAADASIVPLVRGANRIWAMNLLFNPLNAAKAHLEDAFKFYTATGSAGTALRSVIPGATKDTHAMQFVRQTLAGMERRAGSWEMVEQGARGHFDASRRWLEGTLLNDDALRMWARSVQESDPRVFNDWWDTIGVQTRRAPSMPLPGSGGAVRVMDASTAYRSIENGMTHMMGAASDPEAFRRVMMDALASGKRKLPDAIVRMAPAMPVENTRMAGGFMSRGFDMLYGAPARHRGGVFYEHFYDQSLGVLEQRWKGRIIDDRLDDIVAAGVARSRQEAELMIAARNPGMDEMLRNMGLVTRGYLEQTAAAWAAKHARSLLYLGGASSLLGKKAAMVAPFYPAQYDFLRWWSRQMLAGTDLALQGPARQLALGVGKMVPGPVGRGIQRLADGTIHVPGLDARLASRWSHLAAEGSRRDENTGVGHPVSLLEAFTFLPVAFDDPDNFVLNFGAGLGPMPTLAIHYLPPDHPIRKALTEIFPTLDWLKGQADLSPESIGQYLLTPTGRSLTGVLGWLARGASTIPGVGGTMQDIFGGAAAAIFDWDRRPIGYTDIFKQHAGELLAANPNLIPGDPASDQKIRDMTQGAMNEANAAEFRTRLARYVGIMHRFGGDSSYVNLFSGLVAELDFLAGIVPPPQADQLRGLWEKIDGETATPAERRIFADQAASLLFDLPDLYRNIILSRHPELSANMVSSAQCTRDEHGEFVGPAAYCKNDGRIDTSNPELRGEKGAALRQRGFEEGWFEPRPEAEVMDDIIWTYNEARRDWARVLWQGMTGRDYGRGMTKALEETTFNINAALVRQLEPIGIGLEEGPMTGAELRARFRAAFESWPGRSVSVTDNPFWLRLRQNPQYGQLLNEVEAVKQRLDDPDVGITSMYDWPEELKTYVRDQISEIVQTDPDLEASYDTYLRSAFGPLDYEPTTPPDVADLDASYVVDPQRVSVEDGDTIRVVTADGDIRVRLIGINAPEQGQEGYSDAWDQLRTVIDGASEVTLGVYKPDLFPTVQETEPGTHRLYAWLYLDGTPLFDPDVFTATNPTGADVGGDVSDLVALLAAEREARQAAP